MIDTTKGECLWLATDVLEMVFQIYFIVSCYIKKYIFSRTFSAIFYLVTSSWKFRNLRPVKRLKFSFYILFYLFRLSRNYVNQVLTLSARSFIMTVCYYHVTYAFQIESKFYSCLNVKELLLRNRRNILSLSGSNGIRTHNHLVRKWTFNHLAKLVQILNLVLVSSVTFHSEWL